MQLTYNQIQDILPHRYPFLLVDRILDYKAGEYAKGIKLLSGNEIFFQGHFPSKAIFPGVLQLEAMAQVGAVAYLSLPENKGKVALFAGVNKVRFKGLVQPGDRLEMSTYFTGEKAGIGFAKSEATVDGKLVCSAELLFALLEEETES